MSRYQLIDTHTGEVVLELSRANVGFAFLTLIVGALVF